MGREWKTKAKRQQGGIARQKHNAVRETTTRLHEYLHCSIFTPSPIVSMIVVCIMDIMLGIYSTLVSNMREYKTKFWIR